MMLEKDEFLVTYDASKATDDLLVESVKKSGYTARVVIDQNNKPEEKEVSILPQGFAILDKAMAQAKQENKPLVLDFHAEWCIPCRQMEKDVFPNPRVAALLKKVIFVRIDTDKESELTHKLGVVGLPDIRFANADGKIVSKTVGFQDVEAFSEGLEKFTK
jgi:thiol:disulfide interchange protein